MYQLTKYREDRGWSRSELARRAKMNPADLSRVESGKLFAYPAWRKRLSKVLGISAALLFEKVEGGELHC